MSEIPKSEKIYQAETGEVKEKLVEVFKSPEDVWAELMQECQTERELEELEEHVHLFKLGPVRHRGYYLILTNVQPEGETKYLSCFGAQRTPMDPNVFRLRVAAAKELAKLPKMFTDDSSDVFEIPD